MRALGRFRKTAGLNNDSKLGFVLTCGVAISHIMIKVTAIAFYSFTKEL